MSNMVDHLREDNTLQPSNVTLDAARSYAAAGFATFPLPYGQKRPTLTDWPNRATTDEAQHQGWFGSGYPTNIGIATGKKSDVFALDVDKDDDGLTSLAALEAEHGTLPATPRQETPTGGRHYVFRLPPDLVVKNSVKALAPGLDVRGEGGQIVASPSTHPKGGVYAWAEGCAPWEVEPAEAPDWLLALIVVASGKPPKAAGPPRPRPSGVVAEGGRNDALFREASRLRGQGFDLDQITALLHVWNAKNCDPMCDDAEVEQCARQGGRYPPNEWFETNDTGNGQRFARDHGAVVRYVPDLGTWRWWTGTHWADDKGELHMLRLACLTVEGIEADAKAATKEAVAKALDRHARTSGDRPRLRAMIAVAASMAGMSALSTEFDLLPNLLVVANGVVDLRTGELLPHDPARLTTRCLPTAYRPDAPAPTFRAFLDRALPIPEVREFLHVFQGSALHGERSEQLMVFLHGRGRNGKSVYADLMTEMLGAYAAATSASTFIANDKRSPDAARSDLMRLQGARSVFAAESPDKRRLDGTVIKRLTGDAGMPCRALYGDETTFAITFNILLLCNPFPNIDESDDALWARCIRVPFDVVIPRAEQIKNLHSVIFEKEAEGVLAWLVEGAVAYATKGLAIPPVLVAATQAWRRRIGTVERFMRGNIEAAEGGSLPLRWLHSEYILAEQRIRGNPIGEESFRVRLEGLGFIIEENDLGEVVRDVRAIPEVTKLRAQIAKIAA